jgi:hypothetical protein
MLHRLSSTRIQPSIKENHDDSGYAENDLQRIRGVAVSATAKIHALELGGILQGDEVITLDVKFLKPKNLPHSTASKLPGWRRKKGKVCHSDP